MREKKLPRVVFSIHFLVLMTFSSLVALTLLPLFFEHLGGSPSQIGFFVGLFSFASFACRPFGGWLLSRVHPKKVLLAALFALLGITSLYLLVKELDWLLIFIRVFHGASFSIFILAALLIVIMAAREEDRAYAIGVVSTGFLLPFLLVPFIGEEIIKNLGFSYFFLFSIVLCAIPLIFCLSFKITYPRFPSDIDAQSPSFFRLLQQKRILSIIALAFIFEIGLSSSLSFIPLLASDGSGMRSGYYFTFLALTAVFMRLFGGKRFKSWGNPQWIPPAFCFLSLGGISIYFSNSNFALALSGSIWGIGVGILYPHLSALIVKGVDTREKGKILSPFAASIDLGFAVGPIAFGWLSQSLSIRYSFIPFALIVLLSSLAVVLWGRSSLFAEEMINKEGAND